MCAEQIDALELRQQILRSELKTWEHVFTETNGGRKAGKEDIKRIPEIAAKYKEYNKLRTRVPDASTGSISSTPKKSRKRKIDVHEDSEYPSSQHPALIDPYDIPQQMSSTPKIIRTVIGPTPQKNGQILGLFDMLSPSSARTATPSKSTTLTATKSLDTNLTRTPSKGESIGHASITGYLEATPSVSSKRRRMDTVQTPSSQRQRALANLTPLTNRLNRCKQLDPDQTPAFLKRVSDPSTFASLEHELGTDIAYPPATLRLRRKPVGRTLSQLVRSLREQEDQQLDDELALMREIETGETISHPTSEVQDKQSNELPLGADGEHELIEQELSSKESASKTVWRKKGQKRTTRKANIGVNRAKWKPEAEWQPGHENDQDDENRVAGTQIAGQEESELSDKLAEKLKTKDVSATGEQTVKSKKPRKINPNAVAHANFRSLKIKNKNSKGRKGGRFGRR